MMAKDAFSQWLGIEVVDVRPNGATVRMTVRDDMVNGFGVCHGGIDVFARRQRAGVRVEHTRPRDGEHRELDHVSEGDLRRRRARRPTRERGERDRTGSAFYRVTVRARDGEIVALFRGTVYKTEQALLSPSPE